MRVGGAASEHYEGGGTWNTTFTWPASVRYLGPCVTADPPLLPIYWTGSVRRAVLRGRLSLQHACTRYGKQKNQKK